LVQLFDPKPPFLGFISVEGEKEIKNLIILFFKKAQKRSRRTETPLGVKFSLLVLLNFLQIWDGSALHKKSDSFCGSAFGLFIFQDLLQNSSLKVHRRYETLQKNKIVL